MTNLGYSRFPIRWLSGPFILWLLILAGSSYYARWVVKLALVRGWFTGGFGPKEPLPPVVLLVLAGMTGIYATGKLLQLATSRVGPSGVSNVTLTGRKSLSWSEVKAYTDVSGRRSPSYLRLSGDGRVVEVCPSAFQDPGGLRAYLHQHLEHASKL